MSLKTEKDVWPSAEEELDRVRREVEEAHRALQELRDTPPPVVEVRGGGLDALFGADGRWKSVDTVEQLSSVAAEALAYLGATGVCGGTLAGGGQ